MSTLHLTLTRQWFDMIASGEKREEYRQRKPYWQRRLAGRSFDFVKFRNGYSASAPSLHVELLGISEGLGRPEWGGSSEPVFVLQLGRVVARDGQEVPASPDATTAR